MKTRIISGIIMGAIVAAFLALGMLVNNIFITVFIGAIAAVASFELLHNAAGIKSKAAIIGASVYCLLACFANSVTIVFYIYLSIAYAVYAVAVCIKSHKYFNLSHIVVVFAMPMVLAFAFSCLGFVIKNSNGLYYLLLLLNFSSICDMGAYFVGVTLGKHKLCPEVSPKKTVEGAIGGIASAIIFAVIIVLAFGYTQKLISTVLLTIPLCIVGMLGDLFASVIKRSVGIKDYGNLIPGHGGVLDRVDSILLIAPVLFSLMSVGVL